MYLTVLRHKIVRFCSSHPPPPRKPLRLDFSLSCRRRRCMTFCERRATPPSAPPS